MAIPPEPIDSILPTAAVVVVGEITKLLEEGPAPPRRQAPPGTRDVGNKAAYQKATLRVDDVLFSDGRVSAKKGGTVDVLKPVGAYAVDIGTKGPFVLAAPAAGTCEILGRYGPDSWRLDVVQAAIARRP